MRRTLLIPALFFIIFSLALPSQEESQDIRIWEDEHIGITLDRLERVDSWPSELRLTGYEYRQPGTGHNFVLLYLTFVRIEGVHLDIPTKKTSLIDADRNEYRMQNAQFPVNIIEQPDIPASQITLDMLKYEVLEGTSGFISFELPNDADPAILKIVYPYWESKEEKIIKERQIEIEISIK